MGFLSWLFGRRRCASHSRSPLRLEPLEPRVLLNAAPVITSLWSDHPGFRFIAGDDLPSVQDTFHAEVDGDPTSVVFDIGGMSHEDTVPGDGWSATFDMTAATTTDALSVAATNAFGSDEKTHDVDILLLPEWFHGDDVVFTPAHEWASGYSFDVQVTHYTEEFFTPDEWVFYVPGFSDPLFDLAHKRTGFDIYSSFALTSTPAGTVLEEDFALHAEAEALDQQVFEHEIDFSATGSTSYERDFGPAHVEGSVSYGASIAPDFGNDLMLAGVSGTAWMDPTLEITMPLGEARIPLLSVPGIADLVFGATGTIDFGKATGHDHFVVISPTITGGGLGIQQFDLNPALGIGITGSAELDILLGGGTAGASITGRVEQGLTAHYESAAGWDVHAPGNLTLSGDAYYSTLWGFGPSGAMDLFEWQVASWDFLSGTGDATQASETHNYESGVLVNPWVSSMAGPHDSLTFMVDYDNPGQPPDVARLVVDNETFYDMTLISGSADIGAYSVTVANVAYEPHTYGFVFVDQSGAYHVQGFYPDSEDPLRVVAVDPADGGPLVSHNANIRVTFSEAVDAPSAMTQAAGRSPSTPTRTSQRARPSP